MTTNFRDLIIRMANELDNYRQTLLDDRNVTHRLSDEARAALALADEPDVPEGRYTRLPSDEEVEALVDQLGLIRGHANHPCGFWIDDGDAGTIARAVLARWGRPVPAPPADGEVAELTGKLVEAAPALAEMGWDQHAQRILRATKLLQQQALVPVAVSERLPGDQLCWWLEPDEEDEAYGSSWTLLRIRGGTSGYTHWLPAHALPIPQQPETNNGY